LLRSANHGVAQGQEIGHESAGGWRHGAALHVLASDLGLDQVPAKHPLGFLDAAPHVRIAFAQVAGGLLDGARLINGLQISTMPKPKA
jgi:hypothetical protein